jgi:hypothetical protein
MFEEPSQPIETVQGEVSVVEPQSNFPYLSSFFKSSIPSNKPDTPDTSGVPGITDELPKNEVVTIPPATESVIEGSVSVLPFYQRFSQNIKYFKFLSSPLIIDTVKEIKELRRQLTSPYGITEQIRVLINPIVKNESNIDETINKITKISDDRLNELNKTIGEYGFNFVPTITDITQNIKDGISSQIENVNKTLDLKFKNVIINKVNELRTETSRLYNNYLTDTLNLDKNNTPGYYDSVIKIAKTVFEHRLKTNGYLNQKDTITDEQLDVLLRLNGIQFGAYFSSLKPDGILVTQGRIYIGKGKIKSRKSGTIFGYSEIEKDSFLNSDGSISDSDNQYNWVINYSQANKLNFVGHKGGNYTKRNFVPIKTRTHIISNNRRYKSNRMTKNKKNIRRITRKSSN